MSVWLLGINKLIFDCLVPFDRTLISPFMIMMNITWRFGIDNNCDGLLTVISIEHFRL